MWAWKSCLVESFMVEEAICCHVVHVPDAGSGQRHMLTRGEILHADGKIVARCMHEGAHTQDKKEKKKKGIQEAAWSIQIIKKKRKNKSTI